MLQRVVLASAVIFLSTLGATSSEMVFKSVGSGGNCYRLGAFGYFAHPEYGSNFGLQDQIAALKWGNLSPSRLHGGPVCSGAFPGRSEPVAGRVEEFIL